jgi:hypothetical protein
MKIIETAKKHPIIAYILGILPFLGVMLGISNWYLARTTERYEALLAAKDTEMQRVQNQMIEARTELKEGVSIGRTHSDAKGPASGPFSSLEAFSTRLGVLEDRFAEREEFVKAAVGQRVTWSGRVSSVFTIAPEQNSIALTIQSTNHTNLLPSAAAIFRPSFRDRLFALRKGDLVTVSGVIKSASVNVLLDADTITLNQ